MEQVTQYGQVLSNPRQRYFHISSRLHAVRTEIERAFAQGRVGTAMEVGCGEGMLLPLLATHAERVVAVDIEEQALERARRARSSSRVAFIHQDFSKPLEFRPPSADLLVCSDVIEHAHDRRQFVANLDSCLRPGGKLILTTPSVWGLRENTNNLKRILLRFCCEVLPGNKNSRYVKYHVNLYSGRRLKREVSTFCAIESEYTTGLYVPVISDVLLTIFSGTAVERWYAKLDKTVGRSFLRPLNNIILNNIIVVVARKREP